MKHLLNIFFNASRSLIGPVFLFIVSFIVVRTESKELWGEFVLHLFIINFTAHVLNWGSTNFLIRRFSKTPAALSENFYSLFFTRTLFLIPVAIFYSFLFSAQEAILCVLWLIGSHIIKSIDPIITYSKKYTGQLVLETITVVTAGLFLIRSEGITLLYLLQFITFITVLKAIAYAIIYLPKRSKFKLDFSLIQKSTPFFIIGFSGLIQSKIDSYIIAGFSEKEIVGSYQLFFSFFMLIQVLSGAMILAFNKTLYRAPLKAINKTIRLSFVIGILASTFGSLVIYFILNNLYQLDIPNYYYLIGGLFSFPPFIYSFIILLIYRIGKEKEIVVVNYLAIFLNGFVSYLFVIQNQPYLAIVSTAATQWLLLFYYLIRKRKLSVDEKALKN